MLKHILCVDDNEDHRELLKLFFEHEGYEFSGCGTHEECYGMEKNEQFSAVILDNILSLPDGEEIFAKVKASYPQARLIFFTADAQIKSRQRALDLGADAYLVKPNDLTIIVERVGELIFKQVV